MDLFYQHLYVHVFGLSVFAIMLHFASMAAKFKGKRKLTKQFTIATIIAEMFVAGINLTSFVYLLGWRDVFNWYDLLLTLLWGGLAYWNYRHYRRYYRQR